MSLVKICGLTRPEDIEAANEAGPDLHRLCLRPQPPAGDARDGRPPAGGGSGRIFEW